MRRAGLCGGGGPRRWAVPDGWGIQQGHLGASAESLNHP